MFDIKMFAQNLNKFRIKSGIKQNELAELLHVTPQAVSKWESGKSLPDITNLYLIAKTLNISLDDLMNIKSNREKMMIAVDGGGTKTEFILFNRNGFINRKLILEGTNPNICGIEKSAEILIKGIDLIKEKDDIIEGIYCGVSGFLSSNNGKAVEKILNERYPDTKIKCRSDLFNASAFCEKENSITAICGTGVSVCVTNGDEIKLVSGYGHLFDRYGSGYAIGRDSVIAALEDSDGIGEKTIIRDLIENKLSCDIRSSLNYIYSLDVSKLASFSKVVFAAYKENDVVAKSIIDKNMKHLAKNINFAKEKFNTENEVIICGGIMSKKDIVLKHLLPYLNTELKVRIPNLPQIIGAAIQTKNMCYSSNNNDNFKQNLKDSYFE